MVGVEEEPGAPDDTWDWEDLSPAQAKIQRKAENFRLMCKVRDEINASLAVYAKTLKYQYRKLR